MDIIWLSQENMTTSKRKNLLKLSTPTPGELLSILSIVNFPGHFILIYTRWLFINLIKETSHPDTISSTPVKTPTQIMAPESIWSLPAHWLRGYKPSCFVVVQKMRKENILTQSQDVFCRTIFSFKKWKRWLFVYIRIECWHQHTFFFIVIIHS